MLIAIPVLPAIGITQAVASRLFPRGLWLHMLLTMLLWFFAIAAWAGLVNVAFESPLPFAQRRTHVVSLAVRFVVGLSVGGLAARKYFKTGARDAL
ncbi:MAG: hypothetical protein EOO80_03760 [Oxalobacteraceae bacterium]|nr:MAG: hypothetical protein EOO80_03760 [Oxalobacteraceae bacterium]